MIDENLKYSLAEEVAIEDFPDVSLLFLAEQLKLLEINKTTKMVLDLLDGKTSIREISEKISREFKIKESEVKNDVSEIFLNMIKEGVIYPEVKFLTNGDLNMSDKTRFMANPDVSCRVEDEDGAILFNPDNDSTQIINSIGLDIWRTIERHPRILSEVIAHIKEIYEDVPEGEVKKDVEDFIKNLNAKGFIGEVVDEKTS